MGKHYNKQYEKSLIRNCWHRLAINYHSEATPEELLLGYNHDINAQNDDGYTALHIAAANGYLTTFQTLIKYGAQFKADKLGNTPLHYAAEFGHVPIIQEMAKYDKALFKHKNMDGYSAVHFAAENNQSKAIEAILNIDGSLLSDVALNPNGHYPLHTAAAHGASAAIQTLYEWSAFRKMSIDVGTVPFKKMDSSFTALQIACAANHQEAAKALIELGADQTRVQNKTYLNQAHATPGNTSRNESTGTHNKANTNDIGAGNSSCTLF